MQTHTSRRALAALVVVAALVVAGCGSSDDDAAEPKDSGGAKSELKVPTADAQAAAETYADGVVASYDASIASATEMKTAIDAFVANPSDTTLEAAKTAWVDARVDYAPTEAFRFYDGPIDNPDDGPEGQINAWPMDEAYVDYVADDPNAGIIADTTKYPEITTDVIVEANEEGGETNISTGWHAIEFLLWGQDTNPAGPGARPVTDYTTSPTAARRAAYLTAATDLLIADLTSVRDQWDADGGAYREEFLSDPATALASILRGIGALSAGELAGERIAVALETKDQEDEHSCFSDNTNADVVGDVEGVRMVYLADYPGGVTGTSISDLVKQVDPELDEKLQGEIEQSLEGSQSFPATFEAMIAAPSGSAENDALATTLTSIEDQGDSIAQAAQALGVKITLEV